ncbi:DUF3732 domain-containing protein [Streptomyces hydrogenans]|uniref:DUF3732 domain-containing protein n=1 Tax=Streptomyces hydrogenans TaxID=1873719 RepID=A0ABQ3PST5_9ACTN|nr:DUF3732 domain-containing protein [Streptomyces hydrogenans]GHF98206.1 hypothetical protein GCM10018784_07270 [Streptomyces hydrogenans]GHI28094.1 hypothetical protein Shyd_94650 [Streptomyces hydrogenans]
MTFQIRAVTIYGKQPSQVHTVPFKPGGLNIVTGDSRRGKSALLTIIDYCLASSEYPVKSGKVRDYVGTYAITLVKPGQQLFVARRAPEAKKSVSTVMCVLSQAPGSPPPPLDDLRFVTPREVAKDILSDFCGIDRNIRVPAVGRATLIAPSVRHALFFCFQAQNEVANEDVLFHSQGKEWRPNTIRGVIPYFLGATDREQALLRSRLRLARKDLSDHEAKLAAARVLAPAAGQAQALLTEAIEARLVRPDTSRETTAEGVLRLLRQPLLQRGPQAGPDSTDDPISDLRNRRTGLRSHANRARARIADLKTTLAENGDFTDQANEQRARLATLGLLKRDPTYPYGAHCPVCAGPVTPAHVTAAALAMELEHLQSDLHAIGRDTPAIERMISEEEGQLQEIRSRLARNQEEINEVTAAFRALDHEPDDARRAAIVQGRISLYLDTAAQLAIGPRVEDRTEELRIRIAELETLLSEDTQGDRLTSFLSLINQEIRSKAQELELEHSSSMLRLDVNRLTVVADTPDGAIPLKDMGSGDNHLGYHVATLLSLHEWFAENGNPVPGVLILDQPSQVYFPPDHVGEEVLESDDRILLLNIFKAIHRTLRRLDGRLQVIVMEHADLEDPAFSDHVEHRWRRRDGQALVPAAWITSEAD